MEPYFCMVWSSCITRPRDFEDFLERMSFSWWIFGLFLDSFGIFGFDCVSL